jgi:hypothetical protein
MSAQQQLVTKAEFGRRHHLGRTRMKRLLAEGLPTKNGKLPLAAATAWLKANVDSARKNHWHGNGDASLNELRRQREALKIDAGRLALRRASGEVVERTAVRQFLVDRARTERDDWIGWTSAAAARLAAALGIDTGKLFALLEAEVRDQLRRLAGKALEDSDHGNSDSLA